jgi:hypothetical protein
LQGVLDTGSDYIPRTTTLLMDDDMESLTVPIIYLVPIPPRQVRNKVVALDGRYKGQIVTVRDMMHDSCQGRPTAGHVTTTKSLAQKS